jgi:hypothetical protein
MKSTLFRIWLAFSLVITPVAIIGLVMAIHYWNTDKITRLAPGKLTEFVPRDHAQYNYRFAVAGRSYEGRGYYDRGEQGAKAVGKSVGVYPLDPRSLWA